MMFKEYIGDFFFKDGEFYSITDFDPDYLRKGDSSYEILRTSKGKPLFLEDHIERFRYSLSEYSHSKNIFGFDFRKVIGQLASKNGFETGNVKLVCNMTGRACLYIYFIPHRYPTPDQYKIGVNVLSGNHERKKPMVKFVNLDLREKTETLIIEKKIFEVLLVDRSGYVTEGSKSNVFFIKDNMLFTPPVKTVLPGVTRKYVLQICEQNNIRHKEEKILLSNLDNFDSAFITGTSPKVLPIRQIDGFEYNVGNTVLRMIMGEYDKIIQNYMEA